jgi:cytochrome c553
MGQQKPPKGDEKAWKEKTDALLKATKDGNKEAFGKAVNCGACHGMHKG